jgi:MPBQ/MSBQ methyltransferase
MSHSRLPLYLDGLIAAWRSGQTGRDIHLGYWDHPPDLAAPAAPSEFIAAQARLTQRMVALAPVRPGQRVLDVACGFGGALAAISGDVPGLELVGLNIDRRQLEICRSIPQRSGSRFSLVEADACAMPFGLASFDSIFCIEAMFHFRSRRVFLAEAARLLRPGGTLVLSDILIRRPTKSPWDGDTMADALQRDYGPWPELWETPEAVHGWAAAAGLTVIDTFDWSQQTLPSYRTVAPDNERERNPYPDAGNVLRWLHVHGWLAYQIFVFQYGKNA